MIQIKNLEGELVAECRDINVAKRYFRFKAGHNKRKEQLLNVPLLSKKFNIKVIINETNDLWQKNQNINFLKKIEQKEL